MNGYLARQPILFQGREIFAYELLFRASPESKAAVVHNDLAATESVLGNALKFVPLSSLLGTAKGFVNCNGEILLGDLPGILDPNFFVLEILESVAPNAELVAALARLKNSGFDLALDDFVWSDANLKLFGPFFPFLSFVKVDLKANSRAALQAAAEFFKAKGIALLAEKVETEAEFQACRSFGYEYFQGYYFAEPDLVLGPEDLNAGTPKS